jgi:putative DNA primase/helicase
MAAQQSGAVRPPGPQTGFDPTEAVEQFRAALVARDIVAPARIIADGAIHRCDAAGKNGKGDAAYLLHLDGFPAGGLENWRDGKGWEKGN